MPRLLASCLVAGLTLLLARAAEARPSVELSTMLGGADASEYLVRVANPEATDERGVIELRSIGEERAVARTPFDVPAHATRYYRIPSEKGLRMEALAITDRETVRAQDRFHGEGVVVVFDIPPNDEHRLQELRVHTTSKTVITHATFDEATRTPLLTRRAAVYDGVALVVVPSNVFLGLPTMERDALTTWVRTGGDIAFAVTEEADLRRLADLVGEGVKGSPDGTETVWSGGRLRRAGFAATADVGLGRVHLLPFDPWSAGANGEASVQQKLAELAGRHPRSNRYSSGPWPEAPRAYLDPNQGYRSVIAIAGVLLVVSALVTAFGFRRLALRRGMGPAYRFVVGSSAATFAVVCGLGLYAKGGFGARVREVAFADVASGESVAWVERNRTYFASDARTIEITPRDTANLLDSRDARAVLRVDDTTSNVILGDVSVRPWQALAVTERGTTSVGGGVRLAYEEGRVIVANATGATLRHVIVATPAGECRSFGDIGNGERKTDGTPHSCANLGPAWAAHETPGYAGSAGYYLVIPHRLTLVGQLEEGPATMDGFVVEKRTTLLRVTGGAS